MDTKLYVGNMSYDMTETDLRTMFSEAGTVDAVDIIKDRDTGRPKGFAFVTMKTQAEAEKAISMFNQKMFNQRALTVNLARPREERSDRGGGGFGSRGGGGGFGNRGGGGGGGNRGGGGGGGNRRY
jgi:cold-inducible RNA-binding protein